MSAAIEKYAAYYKSRSVILNPRLRNAQNGGIVEGSVADLQRHLSLLIGAPGKSGRWYDSEKDDYVTARLPHLEAQERELLERINGWKAQRLRMGNEPTETIPVELQIERDRFVARKIVLREEVEYLKTLLKEARAEKSKEKALAEAVPPKLKRDQWGAIKLRGGIVESIGNQRCSLNEDGILFIDDTRSAYHGLLVHRYKSKILKPMERETSFRERQEQKRSFESGTPRRKVSPPKPPIYNKESDTISYPDYSAAVLEKLGLKS